MVKPGAFCPALGCRRCSPRLRLQPSRVSARPGGARPDPRPQLLVGLSQDVIYPGGDVPRATGVCCEKSCSAAQASASTCRSCLQGRGARSPLSSSRVWGRTGPNIDHRRVLNLEAYFRVEHATLASRRRFHRWAGLPRQAPAGACQLAPASRRPDAHRHGRADPDMSRDFTTWAAARESARQMTLLEAAMRFRPQPAPALTLLPAFVLELDVLDGDGVGVGMSNIAGVVRLILRHPGAVRCQVGTRSGAPSRSTRRACPDPPRALCGAVAFIKGRRRKAAKSASWVIPRSRVIGSYFVRPGDLCEVDGSAASLRCLTTSGVRRQLLYTGHGAVPRPTSSG